jgi:hypothetical protein
MAERRTIVDKDALCDMASEKEEIHTGTPLFPVTRYINPADAGSELLFNLAFRQSVWIRWMISLVLIFSHLNHLAQARPDEASRRPPSAGGDPHIEEFLSNSTCMIER